MNGQVIPLVRRHPATDPESLLHDMRGPLSVIRGQCHAIVRAGGAPAEAVERLQIIDREVERVAAAIVRLRGALRGVDREEAPARVNVIDLVGSAVRRYGGLAGESGIVLRLDARDGHAEVVGAAGELGRVVDNLVANAIAHAPHGSVVTLAVDVMDGAVLLHVTDDGPDLAPSPARLSCGSVAQRGGGWGMGLAITSDIVARHAGRLSLQHRGHGACIQVALPAAEVAP